MNKKGISMISLVIIVIVLLILIAITATAGFNYITKINNVRAEALGVTIGEAARNRQNDVSVGVSTRYYDGYLFDVSRADFSKIEYIPTDDEDSDGTPDVFQEEGGLWYIIDSESATNLGVGDTEQYLTRNITYYLKPDLEESEKEELVRVVLANYTSESGKGYYVRMPVSVLLETIGTDSAGACPNSPTGTHKFTIPTCTEDSRCIYNCGTTDGPKALGHDWIESTCTEDGRCRRCGITNPNDTKKGHLFISNEDVSDQDLIDLLAQNDCHALENSSDPSKAWVADASKHWHQCIRCGIKEDIEEHNRSFTSLDNDTHIETCSVCMWQSVISKHKLMNEPITANTHREWCTACTYSAIHTDSGWQSGHGVFHYRICNTNDRCNTLEIDLGTGSPTKIIYKEAHYDNDGDWACDACEQNLDIYPPVNFGYEDFGTYAQVINSTTSSVTLKAHTVDRETRVDFYQFGILKNSSIEWDQNVERVNSNDDSATHTFNMLVSQTEYVFYVRAVDIHGNINTPYRINGTTVGFPEFDNIRGVPEKFVKGPYDIGVVPVQTDLPNVFLVYKQNDESAWGHRTPIENMDQVKVTLTKEDEVLYFKFVDDKGNESPVATFNVSCLDNTPPSVTITAKDGDAYGQSALYHQATVTLRDERSGIDTNTEVKYGWSRSNTVAPTELKTITTPNLDIAKSVSFDVTTPAELNGTFYLWVMKGIKDEAGNDTKQNVVGTLGFIIDDEKPTLSNIKMLDYTPADPGIDPGDQLHIRTNQIVTVSFTTSKHLKYDPIVRINDVDMIISHTGKNYVCTLKIDNTFTEGTLKLYIGDIISINGRLADRTYSNNDLVAGPVIYDRTLPVVEYIKKK